MGKGRKLKFVVGSSPRRCSRIWTVKIKQDDVYIMDGSGKYHKITLHGSGVCHSAIPSEQIAHFNMTREQRTAVRWKIVPQSGETLVALTVLMAFDQLGDRPSQSTFPADVFVIPTPPIHSAVAIYFVKSNSNEKMVEYQLENDIHLICSVPLQSGNTLAILYHYTNCFNALIDECKTIVSTSVAELQSTTTKKITSGFMMISNGNNSNYYIGLKF